MQPYKPRCDTAVRLSPWERPGTMSGRKTEMGSIFDVYDKCVRKEQRSTIEGSKDDV